MAEALLRRELASASVSGEWQVASAGTWAQEGFRASENGVEVMRERGLDISEHRSRTLTPSLLAEADLVLTMTLGQAESLRAEEPHAAHKILQLSEMAGHAYDIQDPYGRAVEHYRWTADELEGLISRGLNRIVALAQGSGSTTPR